jgi:membrane fusion protein (multidrug efflux system)
MLQTENMDEAGLGLRRQSESASRPASRKVRRKQALLVFAFLLLAFGGGFGIRAAVLYLRYVSTDNAYVEADVAQVSALTEGPVAAIDVVETQTVHAGDQLVRLDDRDAKIAVDKAQADLLQAERKFDQTLATNAALSAQVVARNAEIVRGNAQMSLAQANLDKATIDLDRRRKLAPSGAVSAEEVSSATYAYAAARANFNLSRAAVAQAQSMRQVSEQELAANKALVDGLTVGTSPEVAALQAKLEQAKLELARTIIRAPIDGVVARRQVQLGQRVAAGMTLMNIVPVKNAHVNANFKEGQLARLKKGQAVTLTADLYGNDVIFHGTVAGFSGGTGSSFALIPAQNATGNWIKVVQRVPVRIEIDPRDLDSHPLLVGLSVKVSVDVSDVGPRA